MSSRASWACAIIFRCNMSLPPNFESPEDYFKEAVLFFQEHQIIYNFSNTDILVQNVLEKIDIKNFDKDVFDADFDLSNEANNCEFIKNILEKIERFKVVYEDVENMELENIDVPLSPKKKHEIVYLAKELNIVCEDSDCRIIVDFGSGLGYLDQLIHETTSLKVLGIECNEGHYVGAKKRQRKYHSDSIKHVKYIKHTINENSDRNIQEYVTDKFEKSNFCITGLHACADLSIDGANLFLKLADAKALVLMPCCYHKMASGSGKFKNFPLSGCLRRIYEENCGFVYLKVPFLRLAAQPPSREDNLEDLVFNLLARATLQLYAHKHNYKLIRNKRKAVRTKTVGRCFSNYLQYAKMGFTLTRENYSSNDNDKVEIEDNFEELNSIWRDVENLKTKAAIFVLLQNILQPIFENFILYDRLVYLKENGIKCCSFKKIFNEKISPRCLALVGVK